MKRNLDLKDVVDTPEGQFVISTVHLIMFGFFENEYETMVFAAEDGQITDWEDLFCARYETREEAVQGHREYFKQLRKGGVLGRSGEEAAMSIRDIIEAATPGPWFEDDPGDGNRLFVGNRADGRTHGLWQIVHMSSDRMCDLTEEAERRYRADARFIATFDPEHVALMEAVCEAENSGTDAELTEAGAMLEAYRKERGL